MMETQIIAMLIYLLTFRLALVIVGGMCIVLGYKLFVKGVFGSTTQSEEMSAKLGEHAFTMKNVAPGTAYALFGALIITVMVLSSPPEFKFIEQTERAGETSKREISGRGGEEVAKMEAQKVHKQAWENYQKGLLDDALTKLRRAIELDGKNADYWDSLAQMTLEAGGRLEEVVGYQEQAVKLDPRNEYLKKNLREYQERMKK